MIKDEIFYDEDADIDKIKSETVAIIGYGIQGRSQALNLRDSGINVVIGNIQDQYSNKATEDGFQLLSIEEASKKSTTIFLLIPDQAHSQIFHKSIISGLQKGDLLVVAHGYSLRFRKIVPPSDIDVCMLAPRMPGYPIRQKYQDGGGVPAFVDIIQDYTGFAQERILGFAKALGFTKSAVIHVPYDQETELDLFIEQFLLPTIIHSMRLSFDFLSKEGYSEIASLMELYASGEIGELLLKSSEEGLYQVWKDNASPTCQFGIFDNINFVAPRDEINGRIKKILRQIKEGTFDKSLEIEAKKGYANLKNYDLENSSSKFVKTQKKINRIIRKK